METEQMFDSGTKKHMDVFNPKTSFNSCPKHRIIIMLY